MQISAFPDNFHNSNENRETSQFLRHYDQNLIMKIILTDIHNGAYMPISFGP